MDGGGKPPPAGGAAAAIGDAPPCGMLGGVPDPNILSAVGLGGGNCAVGVPGCGMDGGEKPPTPAGGGA